MATRKHSPVQFTGPNSTEPPLELPPELLLEEEVVVSELELEVEPPPPLPHAGPPKLLPPKLPPVDCAAAGRATTTEKATRAQPHARSMLMLPWLGAPSQLRELRARGAPLEVHPDALVLAAVSARSFLRDSKSWRLSTPLAISDSVSA